MEDDRILAALEEIRAYTMLAAKEMLTINDAALLSGFAPTYVRELVEEGRIPYYKPTGRRIMIRKQDLNAFLQSNRISSANEIIKTRSYEKGNRL